MRTIEKRNDNNATYIVNHSQGSQKDTHTQGNSVT